MADAAPGLEPAVEDIDSPQVPGRLAFSEHKMPAAATECQWQ